MLGTPHVQLLTSLGIVVTNSPIVEPYTVLVIPNSWADIKRPPEHVIHLDERGINTVWTTVYHLHPCIFHFLWLPWRVCERGQDKDGRGEPAVKQSDSDRRFSNGVEHR